MPRDEVSRVRRLPATELPPTTCDELVTTLVRAGGRVLARQEHGVFLAIRRHLVFVPSVSRVSGIELADVLSAARLTPERFLDLRAAASP